MVDRLDMLDVAFAWLLRWSAQASVVAAVVLAARFALRRWVSPGARYALWLLLALPLVAPLLPSGPFRLRAEPTRPRVQLPPSVNNVAAGHSTGWRIEYGPLVRVPPISAQTPGRPSWTRIAAIAWLVGAAVLGLRVATAHALAVLRSRRAPPVDDEAVCRLLDDCRRAVGTRQRPRVVAVPDGGGPALLGLFRPRLLLPRPVVTRLSPAELRFVFLHELVHLKRGDVLAEWLLTVLQVAHWFNPLVWLAAARCRADREIACDAAVVALSGESGRADYGRTILRLATELSPRFFPRVAAAVGILETHSPLERRLRMIASTPDRKPARFAAVIVVVLAAVAVTFTNAQPKAGEDETKGQAAGSAAPKAAGEDAAKLPANWPDLKAARAADEEQVRQKLLKDQQVRAQLDRPLPEVNFDEVAFADVIDFFRDVTGANVFVNWKALEGAGVNRTTTVSARLRNVRFSKALTVILDSASGGKAKLGFIIDDGVVTISTAEDLDRGETVTRVYDVRDLIVPIPDYEAPPAVQPPAQAEQRPADPEKEEDVRAKKDAAARSRAVEALTQLLQQTVSPGGWGKTWAMRELQGQFIISAPQRIHEPIVQILDHLRESRGVQVIVETKLISADEVALDALPAGLRERVAGALRTGKEPPKAGRGDAPAAKDPKGVYLSAEQVDLVLKAIQDNPRSQVVSAPRLTLFNGQAAYVLTANQRAYVADYSVVKQQGGGTKYEPVFGTAQSGVMLWVRATTSADRKFATLTLNPRLTYLGGMKDVPWEKSPAGEKMTVQRPEVLVSELATTASVPDGQTLLLGGLREYAASGKSTNVLMLVKPTLITQREIELKQFPLLSPKSGE